MVISYLKKNEYFLLDNYQDLLRKDKASTVIQLPCEAVQWKMDLSFSKTKLFKDVAVMWNSPPITLRRIKETMHIW